MQLRWYKRAQDVNQTRIFEENKKGTIPDDHAAVEISSDEAPLQSSCRLEEQVSITPPLGALKRVN